jgi:DNA adenine methylase
MNPAIDAPRRPALRYYGGKWKLAPWIISHFPAHKNYVEPCGGAASVLLQKPRSPLETYNDLDGNVVNFFRVLRDKPDELIRKIKLTPWARAEYELSLTPADGDDVERARRYFVMLWMGMQGGSNESAVGTWARKKTFVKADGTSNKNPADDYAGAASGLDAIATRFSVVQVENLPWQYAVADYDNADALIYFDPPYVSAERAAPERYALEWTDADHANAAELLLTCAGYVVVSGYACPLYADLYERHGWPRVDTLAQTNSGGKRIESIWLSPRTAEALAQPAQATMFAAVTV